MNKKHARVSVVSVSTGSSAVPTAEAFYRRLLEQICEDARRTRARRLAESGLRFWDAMQDEAAKNEAQTNDSSSATDTKAGAERKGNDE